VNTVYRYWAALVVLAVLLQIGFAGYGAFFVANAVDDGVVDEKKFDDGFGLHVGFGYLVLLLTLVLLLIALAANAGKYRVGPSGILFPLLIVQVLLAYLGESVPALGFIHPINALLILGLSGWIAKSAWHGDRAAPSVAAPGV
jgi:tellurite resistance protein TehA-like permease